MTDEPIITHGDETDEAITAAEIDAALEPPPPRIPWGWLRALVGFFAYLAVLLGAGIAIGIIVVLRSMSDGKPDLQALEKLGDASQLPFGILAGSQILTLVGVLLAVWLCRRFIDRRSVVSLGLQLAGYGRAALAGLLWGIALISVGWVILWVAGALELSAPAAALSASQLFGFLLVLAIVGFNEEYLVRGYLLNNLMQSMNRWLALLVSAVVFAAMHMFNANLTLLGFVNLVLAGLVLGVYYVHRRNLWFSVAMHLSWNFFQGPVFGFEVSGLETPSLLGQQLAGPAWLTGGDFGLEGSAVTTVLLALMIVGIHYLYRDPPQEP